MYYPVCGMVHIKDSVVAAVGFLSCYLNGPVHCLMPCNSKLNVLNASLNKTFLAFLHMQVHVWMVLTSLFDFHEEYYMFINR